MDSGAKAIIDRLQPHHRGDDAKNHPLAVLNELANEGKHRKILLAILIANVDKVTFRHFGGPVLPITQARTPTRRYEADAELKVFDSTRAMPEKDIEVVGDPRGDVAFDVAGPASGVSVIEFLAAAHRNIRKEVFEPLEAFLT